MENNDFNYFTLIIIGILTLALYLDEMFMPNVLTELSIGWKIAYYLVLANVLRRVINIFIAFRVIIEAWISYTFAVGIVSLWEKPPLDASDWFVIKTHPVMFGIALCVIFLFLTGLASEASDTKTIDNIKSRSKH